MRLQRGRFERFGQRLQAGLIDRLNRLDRLDWGVAHGGFVK